MRIQLIVGNPPYQDSSNRAVYDKFFLKGATISNKILFITKGLWLKNKGSQLDNSFAEEVQKGLVTLRHYLNKFIFPGVEVGGGLTEFYWNLESEDKTFQEVYNQRGEKIYSGEILFFEDTILNSKEMHDLANRSLLFFKKTKFPAMSTIVERPSYGIETNHADYRESPEQGFEIPCELRLGGVRRTVYVKNVKKPEHLDQHKIAVAEANTSNSLIFSKPFITSNAISKTWIQIGRGKSEEELRSIMRFLESKTVKALMHIKRPGHHTSIHTFDLVPLVILPEDFYKLSLEEVDLWVQDLLGLDKTTREWISKNYSYCKEDQ